ncbi:MAG: tetratricopeptide repeat protein [Candidatus Rifleibacteriota bacterium]
MRIFRILLCLVFFLAACSISAIAQPVEQTFARLFSYDPHPDRATFAEKVPFNGNMADIEVKFIESWVEKKDSASINSIKFGLNAVKNGATLASAETTSFAINNKITKGQTIAETALGNLKFKATVDSFEKNSAGITDLTIVFSLIYQTQDLSAAKDNEANQSSASSMTLCRSLAAKADALPDKNLKSKIGLYQKALTAAPPETASPEAAAFRQMIEQKISSLSGKAPTVPESPREPEIETPPAKVEPPAQPPQIPIQEEKPAVKSPENETFIPASVNPQAKTLYQQAKSLLEQDKGPEGREALRKALEIAPDYYDALVLLGENALANRKYARAKEAFEKAINVNSRDSETLLKFFKSCYYLGEGSTAVDKLQAIKNNNPNDRGITLALAEAFFQTGDLPNAKLMCDEVLKADPENYQGKDLVKRIDRLMK